MKWMLLAAALALPSAAHALDEVQVYGIANFGGAGQCGSSGQTHTVHTSTAAAFRAPFDFLTPLGLWDEAHTNNNSSARGSYFSDASKIMSGDDVATNKGADEADVIYVHTHGGRDTTGVGYSSLLMGNSAYTCSVRTDNDMLWSSDLDIAVIKACQSGDYNVWQDGGYRQQFTHSGSAMRMWNAFHGDSSCGSHVTSYVSDYAWSSLYDGAGENWIDAAYDDDGGNNNDDCPVSIVFGSSSSARASLFEYGGWLDRKDTGSKTGSTYFYVGGCNPDNGVTLPN
jgi:hypothetical protein